MTRNLGAAPKEHASILLVDDNPHGLVARRSVLEELGYHVMTATDGDAALGLLASQKLDLVVTDYKMPGMNGVDLIRNIRASRPSMPIILLSGFVEPLGLNESSTGADIVLPKSAGEVGFLVRSVRRLLNPPAPRKPSASEKSAPAKSATGGK